MGMVSIKVKHMKYIGFVIILLFIAICIVFGEWANYGSKPVYQFFMKKACAWKLPSGFQLVRNKQSGKYAIMETTQVHTYSPMMLGFSGFTPHSWILPDCEAQFSDSCKAKRLAQLYLMQQTKEREEVLEDADKHTWEKVNPTNTGQ